MATKQFYATGAFRYQTRMLKAGDPVELDGPSARLFKALGKITDRAPRKVAQGEYIPTTKEVLSATVAKPQLDHDGDGKAGGSAKGAKSTRAKGAARRKAKK